MPPPLETGSHECYCPELQHCAVSHASLDGADETTTTLDAPLFRRHAAHLSAAHRSYFAHWHRLLALEERAATRKEQATWRAAAADLEASGAAYASLALVKIADRGDAAAGRDRWEHSLRRVAAADGEGGRSLLESSLGVGDLVTLSVQPSACGSRAARWMVARGILRACRSRRRRWCARRHFTSCSTLRRRRRRATRARGVVAAVAWTAAAPPPRRQGRAPHIVRHVPRQPPPPPRTGDRRGRLAEGLAAAAARRLRRRGRRRLRRRRRRRRACGVAAAAAARRPRGASVRRAGGAPRPAGGGDCGTLDAQRRPAERGPSDPGGGGLRSGARDARDGEDDDDCPRRRRARGARPVGAPLLVHPLGARQCAAQAVRQTRRAAAHRAARQGRPSPSTRTFSRRSPPTCRRRPTASPPSAAPSPAAASSPRRRSRSTTRCSPAASLTSASSTRRGR